MSPGSGLPDVFAVGAGRIARYLARLGRDLEAFALPQRCPGCGSAADPRLLLCASCLDRIPLLSVPLCVHCLVRASAGSGAERAAACAAHPDHQAWPACLYDERAGVLIHALKYGERPLLAGGLAGLLERALPPVPRFDLVVEVPLHAARLHERGYNQATLLAQALAERIGVPWLAGALVRVRPTRSQARLGPAARRANLAGAFRAPRPGWLEGRNVLVVDDVLTTGATLEACFEAVRSAGGHPTGAVVAWAQ